MSIFTAADLASMRTAAERLMSDTFARITFAKVPDGIGGQTTTPSVASEAIACRLVTKRTGRESEEELRLLAHSDYLLRYPYNVVLKETQEIRIAGTDYIVTAISSFRSDPHIQNLAGVSLRK